MRPGVNVSGADTTGSQTRPIDTGQAFVAVVSQRGPTGLNKVTSWSQYLMDYGDRTNTNATYWDSVQQYFVNGGKILYVVRLDGPSAAVATANVDTASAGAPYAFVASAVGTGTWYNGLNLIWEVNPDAAGERRVRITHDTDTSISETSPYYASQADLRDWSLNSRYIRLTLGADPAMPAAGTLSLTGGLDDAPGVVTATKTTALTLFTKDLGTGNVNIPGAVSAGDWTAIMAHADAMERSAILDYPDTADEATLLTLARGARTLGRVAAGFAGWLVVPHIGGRSKTVPPGLAVAGKIAAHDAATAGLGQNKPVAGRKRGRITRALSVSQDFGNDDKITRLNGEGVNLIRDIQGFVTIYGWRSLAHPTNDAGWRNFGHRRLQAALYARISALLEDFMFEEIDGEGLLFGRARGDIKASILEPYFRVGSLYGDSLDRAARVDTADPINTPTTIQDGQFNVNVTVVESEFAEEINVLVIKSTIEEGVGA